MPVRTRATLVLAALSLLVAGSASVAALYHRDPEIGLHTGGSGVEAQQLHLETGTTPTTAQSTTTAAAPTTTAATAPALPPTTAAPATAEEPVGCVLGTYDEASHSCRWLPVAVTGRVVSSTGRPLAGICVTSLLPPATTARTDAQGRYTLLLAQGGDALAAAACGETRPEFGWITGRAMLPSAEPGTTTAAPDIVLTERGGAYGIVVDPDGNPLSGICMAGGAASDRDGRFATAPLDPGRHAIGASGGGTATCPTVAVSLEQVPVTVQPGAWTGPVTVVAHPKAG